jgi:hypothetical protein
VLLALIFFSFFGMLTPSAWTFPQTYYWRYQVISNLLSPCDNPNHYWFAAYGLALAGFLMPPFAGHLQRYLHGIACTGALEYDTERFCQDRCQRYRILCSGCLEPSLQNRLRNVAKTCAKSLS